MRCNILYYLNDDIKRDNARILIIIGDTLQEASQKAGLTIDQVKRLSKKEKLQEQQRAFKELLTYEDWENLNSIKLRISRLAKIILKVLGDSGRGNNTTKELINNILSNADISQLIF